MRSKLIVTNSIVNFYFNDFAFDISHNNKSSKNYLIVKKMSQEEDTFYDVIRFGIAAVIIPIVIALLFHFTPLSF